MKSCVALLFASLLTLCEAQGPVSPVKLIVDRVDSSSSGSCDLHVTCRTHNSHISSTFRCVDRVCSQEGGKRSEVTTSGASLEFYLLHNTIICNHRNQHHMTQDLIPAEHLCPSKPDSPIGWAIAVSIVTVLLVIFVVVFVWLYIRRRRRIKQEAKDQRIRKQEQASELQDLLTEQRIRDHLLQEQGSALQDLLTAHLIAEQHIRLQMEKLYVESIRFIVWEIYSHVKKVKVNKRRSQLVWWRVNALDNLVMSLKEDQTSDGVQKALKEVKDTLETALSLIESHTEDSWVEHVLKADSHEDEFVNVNKCLSDAFQILSGVLNEDQIREASKVFDRDSMMEDEEAKKEDEAALKTPAAAGVNTTAPGGSTELTGLIE